MKMAWEEKRIRNMAKKGRGFFAFLRKYRGEAAHKIPVSGRLSDKIVPGIYRCIWKNGGVLYVSSVRTAPGPGISHILTRRSATNGIMGRSR